MNQSRRIGSMMLCSVILTGCLISSAYAQETQKEKAVKAYYASYENKDWATLSNLLDEGFTFTSPAGDDHISKETYHQRCWPTSKFTKKVKFVKMSEKGDDLFALVEISTTDNKVARNFDVFSFDSRGKIKSHECFFGPGVGYPGNSK